MAFMPVMLNYLREWEGKPPPQSKRPAEYPAIFDFCLCPPILQSVGILHVEGIPEGRRAGRLPRVICRSDLEALRDAGR